MLVEPLSEWLLGQAGEELRLSFWKLAGKVTGSMEYPNDADFLGADAVEDQITSDRERAEPA